jgi:P pilus assembly chaperone PapD
VVAAIILIAVTVAVSIAVAAWMGALTFTFMKTEEVKVLSIDRSTWSNTTATLTLKNSGTSDLTIETVRVNDNDATMTQATLAPGEEHDFAVGYDYEPGTKYEFAFYTATGNRYPYTSTAP